MKMRILAPEVTVGETKYTAGKTVDVQDENEAARLERIGYAAFVNEADSLESPPKAVTAAKK